MIREWLDRIFLPDSEYKKKYCPFIYDYLFNKTLEERSQMFKEAMSPERVKTRWDEGVAAGVCGTIDMRSFQTDD